MIQSYVHGPKSQGMEVFRCVTKEICATSLSKYVSVSIYQFVKRQAKSVDNDYITKYMKKIKDRGIISKHIHDFRAHEGILLARTRGQARIFLHGAAKGSHT